MGCLCPHLRQPRPARSSDSSSSEDDDDDDDGDVHCEGSGTLDLKLGVLESYHQMNSAGDSSVFAENGADRERLKNLLKHPQCACKCTMPLDTLLKCCKTFWGLCKSTQDAVLWSLQNSSERFSVWSIEGQVSIQNYFHVALFNGLCNQTWTN